MEISLQNLIENRVNDGVKWRPLTDNESYIIGTAFRKFLEESCRANSKRATQFKYLVFKKRVTPYHSRLLYDTNTNKVTYIAGQEYRVEIERLKCELLK